MNVVLQYFAVGLSIYREKKTKMNLCKNNQ